MDKVKITKDNLKFLLDLLDEAERISYDRCKAESPGIEVDKSLGCAIWMHAFEVGYIETLLKVKYKDCAVSDESVEDLIAELRQIRSENKSIRDYL
mgnify:FL=1